MYIFCFAFLLFTNCTSTNESKMKVNDEKQVTEVEVYQKSVQKAQQQLALKAKEALAYCERHDMNTDFCLLFDVKIHSGKNRMFVWDFKGDSVLTSSLCAHGCGKDSRLSTGDKPLFSNENGSYLTSLGKYKIGIRSYSNWGINVHYKMHGLESTNNNAFKRIVVLHSYTPVPHKEIYPNHLPMGISQGCPVVDDDMMTLLDAKLSNVSKPVLLWVYY